MRVLLGIPTFGSPAPLFVETLATLALPPTLTAFDRYVATGNFVPAQRELIAERAIAVGADVLVMCDDDMVLPPQTVARLCAILEQRPRCAVAGALYYARDGIRPMVVTDWNPAQTTTSVIPAFDDRTPVTVDAVGFGCVALRVDVLRELMPPIFAAQIFVERTAARARICNEDFLFCHRVRERGWEVILDPGVRCGHFDRASGTIFPHAWEPPEITNQPRMCVERNGTVSLLPVDRSITAQHEDHRPVPLEYILIP